MSETRYFRVSGRVQGVGFRVAASDYARACALAGWVRNRSDGDVELVARGEPASLQKLREWLHRGPATARVRSVVDQAIDEHDLPWPFSIKENAD